MNYDFHLWHPNCPKELVAHSGRVHVYCRRCGLVAELEGISQKVTVEGAYQEAQVDNDGLIQHPQRPPVGQVSKGHPSHKEVKI